MRTLAKQILVKAHLFEFVQKVHWDLSRLKRKIYGVDRSIIENYISTHEVRKLHIGCGENIVDGWLNSDYYVGSARILHLDAAGCFPFDNHMFDYIFSEHMIEHISYSNGFAMLSECHRVLRKNGQIRVSTPDLRFLLDLYQDKKSELQYEYIKWATDNFIGGTPYYDDTFVINNFVRDWEHLFIYDEKTLRLSMERAGFSNIVRCELNKSKDDALRSLENEKRMPRGFLDLESFTLEGTKL
jgi:predicted SAM-dependent methyltransferase